MLKMFVSFSVIGLKMRLVKALVVRSSLTITVLNGV